MSPPTTQERKHAVKAIPYNYYWEKLKSQIKYFFKLHRAFLVWRSYLCLLSPTASTAYKPLAWSSGPLFPWWACASSSGSSWSGR